MVSAFPIILFLKLTEVRAHIKETKFSSGPHASLSIDQIMRVCESSHRSLQLKK